MNWWKVTPDWVGQDAFIIAGGPSVLTQNIELLRDRRIIAINSSWERVPWADILFFGDSRWWRVHQQKVEREFKGRIVTVQGSAVGPRIHWLKKRSPPGLARASDELMQRRTSLTGAINLADPNHLGSKRIILLGADGKAKIMPDGKPKTHHHAPHPWPQKPDCWKEQRKDLVSIVAPLKELGVEVLNASPGSTLDMWPIVKLEDVLQKDELLVA